jgi:hypothetical protein
MDLATKIAVTAAKGSAVAGSTLTLVKGTLHVMNWFKTKIAVGLAASALLAVGVCAAMTHRARLQEARRNEAQAFQEKLAAEQAEQAARAEQAEKAEKALRERQNQTPKP